MRVRRRLPGILLVGAVAAAAIATTALGAGAALAAPATVTASAAPTGGEWTQPDSDPARSRSNEAPSTISRSTAKNLKLLHTLSYGKAPECGNGAETGPVVSNGVLYVVRTRTIDDAASNWLTATNLRSGRVIWQKHLTGSDPDPTTVWRDLAISGGKIFIAQHSCFYPNLRGFVEAFSVQNGRSLWTSQSAQPYDSLTAIGSRVVASATTNAGDGIYTVMNESDGKTVWTRTFTYCPPSSLVVQNGLVMARDCDSDSPEPDPKMLGLKVTDGSIGLLNEEDAWRQVRGDAQGTLFFGLTNESRTTVMDAATGATRYHLAYDAVIAADQSQFYTACSGLVCAYDKATGALNWKVELSSGATPPGAVANGVLYLADGSMLDTRNGTVLGDLLPGTVLSLGLSIAENRVIYVWTDEYRIFGL